MDNKITNRLGGLLEYVRHVSKFKQKPIFALDEYKQLTIWEHQLKERIGVQHNSVDLDGIPIWLRIERLTRIAPPPIPEHLQEWLTIGNEPDHDPQIKNTLIKTLPEKDVEKLIAEGRVNEIDVSDPLKALDHYQNHDQESDQDFNQNLSTALKVKDVIFRLKNNPTIKSDIDDYLNEQWLVWSEEEKPRRETIKLYDKLFTLQQTIEAQGNEQAVELIWGIGMIRWLCESHKLDHPLIEKPVEIEVNRKDGAIFIHPRKQEVTLAVDALFALDNVGVDTLLHFGKKHFAELPEDVELSPYIHESFEPVLRQASTHLSEKGHYWPDINPDQENRQPNKISEFLEVTDSWVIFARPRGTTGFVKDIERFQKNLQVLQDLPAPAKRLVTTLSNKKPSVISSSKPSMASTQKKEKTPLFFPKAFNEAQVQIIDRLEKNDGVVVQGPPGTGKTHTIANIICHYLATGRSVLVTSKGEPALSVLQDQIPESLRGLTISLLTNEKQGMKQLEAAVQLLAGLASQTNLTTLQKEAEVSELRVEQLEREIRAIDREIQEWGLKQLNPVTMTLSGSADEITAMQLAQQVIDAPETHQWLPDKLGSSEAYNPLFMDADIATLRQERRVLGNDIAYIGKRLPNPDDMLDSANIMAIHDDLVASVQLVTKTKKQQVPLLAVSVEKSVERAEKLVKPLTQLFELLQHLESAQWLRNLFYAWIEKRETNEKNEKVALFDDLKHELVQLLKQRQVFVKTQVEVHNPALCKEAVITALNNLIGNKKPFGFFAFGTKEAKAIIHQIRVNGEVPTHTEQWQLSLDYVLFQEAMRKFIIKWNHVGQELDLPELSYVYGALFKDIQSIVTVIKQAENSSKEWHFIRKEVALLFPHGIDVCQLAKNKTEIEKAQQAITLNTSRIRLEARRLTLQQFIQQLLASSEGAITEAIKQFIQHKVGNPLCTSEMVIQEWQQLNAELDRLIKLTPSLHEVEAIAQKIADSGAPKWAESLKTESLLAIEDALTPIDWYESWQWKRRKKYLQEIDGREKLKALSSKRMRLDVDLKKTFSELVRIKTNIGLHQNMTERVQSALMRFVSAIGKMGKGTGKRAPRYRRDAYKAMQDCYSGVPCWIMPTWRVSESLPADFGVFDLVIIDEASQSDISALPAIMRGKKLLVVGDDKQISPPPSFLKEEQVLKLKHNFLKEQPFSELLLPGSSIYDLANIIFPSQRILLTEHFRCVEPIIRFSMQFYSEPLIPLRIPKASEKLTPPLIDVYVQDGSRDERKKINKDEAQAIVAEIKQLVSNSIYHKRSIGVVSLIGHQQARYIQDQLLVALGEEVYQKHQIACGDAATFQGKERDIIFLSMVVGKGQGIALTKREDEQRVNVALSRARDRMYLYRSIEPDDLRNGNDLRLKILRHFSHPMTQKDQVNDPLALCDSEFERDVYKKLVEKGYSVTPQVQVGAFSIDLVVEGENDRRLAIELDGDKYHPPEKWIDDWRRQRTMERVGWQFWRCWGSSYTIDPDGCIKELVDTLEQMGIQPCEKTTEANIYTEYRIYKIDSAPPLQSSDVEYHAVLSAIVQ